MEDTLVTIIGVIIAIIIMFIIPVILIADRSDDISQLVIQTVTTEFVDDIIKTGQITEKRYQQFINSLSSSGNTYEIDIEVKILDENTAKIVTDAEPFKIGKNTYYSIYTSQIEEKLQLSATESRIAKLVLKQGDIVSVIVKNESDTFSQALKNFYYNSGKESTHILAATASGTVAINGRYETVQ